MPLFALFRGNPNLIVSHHRKRDDLLDVHENSPVVIVRLETHTPDLNFAFNQPEDRCRYLASELSRGQNDPDVLRERIFIRLDPSEETKQFGLRVPIDNSVLCQVKTQHFSGLIEGLA
ncbi:hypothetical protein [Ruegeria arenilitoris]|uniref:hypothetical protein n=1 Tax=Ruegeria arenilitoris TaxID=1173585 RepID=UPI00147FEF93|nr:hypothetical protein [Ruegeria arenilitoris]